MSTRTNSRSLTDGSLKTLKRCAMHPAFLTFVDPSVEQEFLASHSRTTKRVYFGALILTHICLVLASGEQMFSENVTWRTVHMIRLMIYLAVAQWAPSVMDAACAMDKVADSLSYMCDPGSVEPGSGAVFRVAEGYYSGVAAHFRSIHPSIHQPVAFLIVLIYLSQRRSPFERESLALFVEISIGVALSFPRRRLFIVAFVVYLRMLSTFDDPGNNILLSAFVGLVADWTQEKMARQTFASALKDRDQMLLTAQKKGEAELAHLQGNFLFQIAELYPNDLKIQSIVCRAKMWSQTRGAFTKLHDGTYVSTPTVVHMPMMLLDLGVEVITCITEHVEMDEPLFLMCGEQAVANGAKYGVGSVRVQQILTDGFLKTEFLSENKETTVAVPPDHNFFEEGTTTQGTGVGLATVKKVCDHLGGTCALQSVGFNHTKLTVSLPCRIAQPPCERSLVPTVTPTCTVIIDDDEFTVIIVKSKLAQLAPSTQVVPLGNTPEERQQLCKLTLEARPQLVVCDNNIAEVSGIDVARELRANGFDGVLLLHTACSAEEKEALETDNIDLFDAITPKIAGGVKDALSIYARIVELSRIPEELYTSLQSDSPTSWGSSTRATRPRSPERLTRSRAGAASSQRRRASCRWRQTPRTTPPRSTPERWPRSFVRHASFTPSEGDPSRVRATRVRATRPNERKEASFFS